MLEHLGWDPAIEEQFAPYAAEGLVPARVAVEQRGALLVYLQSGERWAELSGRLRHTTGERGDLPAVGDWVAIADPEGAERALVQAVLPRRTKFSRLAASDHGGTVEQVVAANVDVVFLTAGLDGDFNARRLERYLTLAWESGASPVVVLTKTDLCADVDAALLEVGSVSACRSIRSATSPARASTRSRSTSARAGPWPRWARPAWGSRRSSTALPARS